MSILICRLGDLAEPQAYIENIKILRKILKLFFYLIEKISYLRLILNLISKGFEKNELKSKSKLIIIGTMNKGVAGINKLQEAFEDRFIYIYINKI
jgi:hypothetical protein